MKNISITQLERKRILEIAKEYKEKGYKVDFEPTTFKFQLPNIQPDLIATSDNDNVVIEIVSRDTLRDKKRLESIAKAVSKVPGWRFELVITNPQQQLTQDISITEIKDRLSQAKQLLNQSFLIPSYLYSWSALEALLRKLASSEGEKLRGESPLKLVKTLYSRGIIARSDYELLNIGATARNIAIHGNHVPDGMFTKKNLNALLKLANRYLNTIEPTNRPIMKNYSYEDLVSWFFDNFEDPAEGVPYEGGYIYVNGGPYDAWDELSEQFPLVDEKILQQAVDEIQKLGFEWVKKGQY